MKNKIVLVKSKIGKKHAWWYVLCSSIVKAEILLGVFAKKTKLSANLLDYGKILRSGWGDKPPKEVVKEIEKL